jgi:NTE family protein
MTQSGEKHWHWRWLRKRSGRITALRSTEPRIGLALGGGFARGIAHVGVLRVLERENIPIYCATGVSAGSIVAAAYASGATVNEIGSAASTMRLSDVAKWGLSRLGFAGSERMTPFLQRLLKHMQFDDMKIPLGVIATDIRSGRAIEFRDCGDVAPAIRASCSYPGLFRPVEFNGHTLVDGAISVEVPSRLARKMGATHVISVCIPNQAEDFEAHHMFEVINRCFQIMMANNEDSWRDHSDIVLLPDVGSIPWDGFENAKRMIEAGEAAAESALPEIREWIGQSAEVHAATAASLRATTTENSPQSAPAHLQPDQPSCLA